jgi:hypothetical protein
MAITLKLPRIACYNCIHDEADLFSEQCCSCGDGYNNFINKNKGGNNMNTINSEFKLINDFSNYIKDIKNDMFVSGNGSYYKIVYNNNIFVIAQSHNRLRLMPLFGKLLNDDGAVVDCSNIFLKRVTYYFLQLGLKENQINCNNGYISVEYKYDGINAMLSLIFIGERACRDFGLTKNKFHTSKNFPSFYDIITSETTNTGVYLKLMCSTFKNKSKGFTFKVNETVKVVGSPCGVFNCQENKYSEIKTIASYNENYQTQEYFLSNGLYYFEGALMGENESIITV